MSVDYYDPQGRPITDILKWAKLFNDRKLEDDRWWRVDKTQVGDVEVSTVWLGLDHNYYDDGPPLIFESMVFGGEYDDYMDRYSTWEQAQAGHDRIVAALRKNENPFP